MTNHRAGRTNTKDPRGSWRAGKVYKRRTARFLRLDKRRAIRQDRKDSG